MSSHTCMLKCSVHFAAQCIQNNNLISSQFQNWLPVWPKEDDSTQIHEIFWHFLKYFRCELTKRREPWCERVPSCLIICGCEWRNIAAGWDVMVLHVLWIWVQQDTRNTVSLRLLYLEESRRFRLSPSDIPYFPQTRVVPTISITQRRQGAVSTSRPQSFMVESMKFVFGDKGKSRGPKCKPFLELQFHHQVWWERSDPVVTLLFLQLLENPSSVRNSNTPACPSNKTNYYWPLTLWFCVKQVLAPFSSGQMHLPCGSNSWKMFPRFSPENNPKPPCSWPKFLFVESFCVQPWSAQKFRVGAKYLCFSWGRISHKGLNGVLSVTIFSWTVVFWDVVQCGCSILVCKWRARPWCGPIRNALNQVPRSFLSCLFTGRCLVATTQVREFSTSIQESAAYLWPG